MTPIEAARAAAAMPPADPAVWLDRAERAGVHLEADDEGGLFMMFGDSDPDERVFLDCWLRNTPGGHQAVVALLRQRCAKAGA